MLQAQFETFAKYNAWANQRLYDAAEALSNSDYRADRGAFFKSVHGTLNHLLAADRIWLRRFTGEGSAPDSLDAILFEAFRPLREARATEDRRIIDFISSLDEARLSGAITYRPITSPGLIEQSLWSALTHVFNHQTHHRGQIHALLTSLVGRAPELDLLVFQRLAQAGQA